MNSASGFLKGRDLDWFGAKNGSLFYHNCLKYLLVLNNSSSGGKISFNMRKIKEKLKKHKTKSSPPQKREKVKQMDPFGDPAQKTGHINKVLQRGDSISP